MRLIAGTSVWLYLACVLAFLVPFIRGGIKSQISFNLNRDKKAWSLPAWTILLLLAWYAAGYFLHMDAVSGFPYFLGGLLGYCLLGHFSFAQAGMRGALLLMGALAISSASHDVTTLPVPLMSTLLGLSAGRFITPNTAWTDYLLPSAWLVGIAWIILSIPEAMQGPMASLLAIFLSVSLLMRAVQDFGFIPQNNALIRPVFVVVTGTLVAWLLCQTLLLQPSLMPWVWLFAGGLLLAFLLPASSTTNSSNTSSGISGAIQLVLIGIAALVASRLFGTLGWMVLAAGLLSNARKPQAVALASLFFIGRSLLQVYLFQYNPNVTGINITHPYASAALYVGLAAMLLLPNVMNTLLLPAKLPNDDGTEVDIIPDNILAWAVLFFVALLAGALANYFLHAEATGSLLVALLIGGLGVGLLGRFQSLQAGAYALLLPIVTTSGALLSQELLSAGNEAEKSQKIIVLGAMLLVFLLVAVLLWRTGSGRKPVSVA
jgi:hypothetical protein